MIYKSILYFTLPFAVVFGSTLDPVDRLYDHIHNLTSPSRSELEQLQQKLLSVKRPILSRMKDKTFIMRKFQFIGAEESFGKIRLRSDRLHRENCIITYASLNEHYPRGIKRLVRHIRKSDFCGHMYYQIGGWPNIEGGDLDLLHVPFGFKLALFKQMLDAGYQRVLWIDSSVVPLKNVSMQHVMELIGKRGMFVQINNHTLAKFMHPDVARYFGYTLEQAKEKMSVSAAIIGFDFTRPEIRSLFEAWYAAAHDSVAFYSPRSDQTALSLLIHRKGLADRLFPMELLANTLQRDSDPENLKERLFLMERTYVKKL